MDRWIRRHSLALLLVGAVLFLLPGCSGLGWNQPGAVAPAANTASPAGNLKAPPTQSPTQYYDFPDVPIPAEMSLRLNDSQVFQSGEFKTGLLVLRGRVDPGSLIAFFQAGMDRNGWRLLGSTRYRKSILLFTKPGKSCVITIYEKYFYTYAEIYVLPTVPENRGA